MGKKKKTRAKKNNFRLNRAARRTVAALLMITALIVAAIPGQDTSAQAFMGPSHEGWEEENVSSNHYTYQAKYYGNDGLIYTVVGGNLSDVDIRVDYDTAELVGYDDVISYTTSSTDASGNWIPYDTSSTERKTSTAKYVKDYSAHSSRAEVNSITVPKEAGVTTFTAGVFDGSLFPALSSIDFNGTLTAIPANAFSANGSNIGANSLTNVVGTGTVQSIGASAFEGVNPSGKLSVSPLNAVTTIDQRAFFESGIDSMNAPALKSIGSQAFSGSGIKTFTFGSALETIGNAVNNPGENAMDGVFSRSKLTSVDMKSSKVKIIPAYTFSNCADLQSVSVGGETKTIQEYAFTGDTGLSNLALADTVEEIGKGAFSDCTALDNVVIPSGLKDGRFRDEVFKGCTNLKNVAFSENPNYTKIPSKLFSGCTSLKEVTFPEGVSSFASDTFENCNNLEKLTLPETLLRLPDDFDKDSDLKNLTTIKCYGDTSFPNEAIFGDPKTPRGSNGELFTIVAPDGSKAAKYAEKFGYRFSDIEGKRISSGYFSIDGNGIIVGFDAVNYDGGSALVIDEEVGGIPVKGIAAGTQIFAGKTNIETVTIPECVTQIAAGAFNGCTNLKHVIFQGDGDSNGMNVAIGADAFKGCDPEIVLHGAINPSSLAYNYAMDPNNCHIFREDRYGISVKHSKDGADAGMNVLVQVDDRPDIFVPAGVDTIGTTKTPGGVTVSIFCDPDVDRNRQSSLKSFQADSLKVLPKHAFLNCSKLTNVVMSATSLDEFGVGAFRGCDNLSTVDLVGDGKFISDKEQGVIFTTDRSTLVEAYNPPGDYTIPAETKKLYDEAFAGNNDVQIVNFVDGVTDIPVQCFEDCEGLRTVNINSTTLKHIEDRAFADDPNLKTLCIPSEVVFIDETAGEGDKDVHIYSDSKKNTAYEFWEHYKNNPSNFKFHDDWVNPGKSTSSTTPPGPTSSSTTSSSTTSSSTTSSSSSQSSSGSSSKSSSSSGSSSSSSSTSNASTSVSTTSGQADNNNAGGGSGGNNNGGSNGGGYNGGSGGSANRNGNASIDADDSGLDNTDLISGSIDGGADNYVIKIKKSDEATRAFENALINEYGSLDDLRYYAMDISLYDSTGTNEIVDPQGVSVTITLPIPEELALYGGNNRAAAVKDGNLEQLGTRFSSIDGTPCVTFTATHFSPYGLYVDVTNLSAGGLDSSPKTGDPISPKWFLVIGLAALSIFLFLKKDPVPVKAAA